MVISLGITVFRYQNTVFVKNEPKNAVSKIAAASDRSLQKEVKPLTFYSGLVAARDIFRFESTDSGRPVASVESASDTSANFAARYLVQGILLDKNPQAIIKDIQGGKTHFLHRNGMLEGATLTEIRGNQVLFNLNGETLELIKK